MPIDYETLRLIWWILLGLLLIGFAIMDGFDLGIAMWLPLITKNDVEKRILINSIGPTWEGNQVWFILGGGAIFAAWPMLYALSFSGFYLAMLVVLLALILRPVGFKYRSKLNNPKWRNSWDYALFIGGFVPSLIFGVAIGNVLQGVPFYFDTSLRPFYTGSFLALLNPFALLCGCLSVTMLAMHGAYFINIKTEGSLQLRAIKASRITGFLTIVLFILGGLWIYTGVNGYSLLGAPVYDGPSNPLFKQVAMESGAWLSNYQKMPLTLLAPVLGVVFSFLAMLLVKRPLLAFISSALSLFGIIATVGISMFPFILPSSTNPNQSLTVWDSSSSQLTLFVMLGATVIFLPLVIVYTSWVYHVLRGKITINAIRDNDKTFY
ncbi:cytochrome d ubiquinol oxidase subunit II [Legionella micdadei]|uniref:cytochrome d ubiquinol oxidase subunit II n=1 Tax=Legionella micdadei TaxID=451 RepID=UPI0009EF785F|nr:cytochrome d ubiquinol oxidase subunit II [Legionella micdadei]ARG99022.1 cytochrome d ubiquinol oxidase subunit II [Legionella micdadei]